MCIYLNLMIFTKIIRGFISAMRAAYVSKIAEKAGDSPAKFITEVNKLKSQSGGEIYNTIFSGKHMKELDALHEVSTANSKVRHRKCSNSDGAIASQQDKDDWRNCDPWRINGA